MERVTLKRCKLVNFESHADSEIEFSNGFNAIVGPSCSGKTSLSRALRAVTVPKSFSQGWVREGYPFCTIRWESNLGWLEAKKGEGINEFSYFINNETPKAVDMKAPGEKAFEIAKKILGVDSIRIETVGDKKKTNSRIDINLMKQNDPEGLLDESGKNKLFLFDSLCGIMDSEDIRDGIKSKLGELKKNSTELLSQLSQIKSGGIEQKKVNDAREEYNSLADDFDSISAHKQILIEIIDTFSIMEGKRSEIQVLDNSLLKDYWLPDGGIVNLFRANRKKWVEELGLDEGLIKSWKNVQGLVETTGGELEKISTINVEQIDSFKQMKEKLFHVEQFINARLSQETIELKIDSLGSTVDAGSVKDLLQRKDLVDSWVSIEGQLAGLQRSLEGLAVVCDTSRVRELLTLLEAGRVLYKSKVDMQGAVSRLTIDLRDEDFQIEKLNKQKKDLLSQIDCCPVTGRAITNICSLWDMKEEK